MNCAALSWFEETVEQGHLFQGTTVNFYGEQGTQIILGKGQEV